MAGKDKKEQVSSRTPRPKAAVRHKTKPGAKPKAKAKTKTKAGTNARRGSESKPAQPARNSGMARLETLLRESEERFKNTFEHAGVGIAHAGLDERFTRVNRTLCDFLGYEPGELLSKRFHDITHPDDLAEDVYWVFRLMAGEVNSFNIDKRYLRKDGAPVWAGLTVALVRGPSGKPEYLIAVIQDIGGRREAAEALMYSEARLKEAQRLAHIGNWELDFSTNRLSWSNEIFRIFGIAPEKFGFSYEAFLNTVHPDDRAMVDKAYTDSLKNRMPYDVDHRILMPDGRVRYVHESCETHFDRDGMPLRSVGTVQDITPMKLAEERIMQALMEKEVLLKEVHHRVKNNMQIISSLQQLQARNLKNPEAAEAMQDFYGRIRSMALVHERLYESGDLSHVDVAGYLLTLVQNILYSYGRPGIEADVDARPLSLEMDCLIPIGLIVNELVTNAIKHAFPSGTEDGHIVVSLGRAGQQGMISLSVSDNGSGMHESVDFETTGSLGLMIVRALSAQIKGLVSIDRGGHGTRITIGFPEPHSLPAASVV